MHAQYTTAPAQCAAAVRLAPLCRGIARFFTLRWLRIFMYNMHSYLVIHEYINNNIIIIIIHFNNNSNTYLFYIHKNYLSWV